MVTSTDGGTLWSSKATLAVSPTALYTLELAPTLAGAGVAVNGGDTEAGPIWGYVIDPRRANVAARASATPPSSCAPAWATASGSSARRARAKRTATVRLVPRHGRARTLRLAVRGCGRIA